MSRGLKGHEKMIYGTEMTEKKWLIYVVIQIVFCIGFRWRRSTWETVPKELAHGPGFRWEILYSWIWCYNYETLVRKGRRWVYFACRRDANCLGNLLYLPKMATGIYPIPHALLQCELLTPPKRWNVFLQTWIQTGLTTIFITRIWLKTKCCVNSVHDSQPTWKLLHFTFLEILLRHSFLELNCHSPRNPSYGKKPYVGQSLISHQQPASTSSHVNESSARSAQSSLQ